MIQIEPNQFTLLLVDDIPKNIQILGSTLKRHGYKVEFATNGKNAIDWLSKKEFDLILLDIMMPEMDGLEACTIIRKQKKYNDMPIIFLTSKVEKEDVLKGFRIGAQDYITKPFDEDELIARIKTHLTLRKMNKHLDELVKQRTEELDQTNKKLEKFLFEIEQMKDRLQEENYYMQEEIKLSHNFESIIGNSSNLKEALGAIENVAKTNSTVLILGETGTGKELAARAIHDLSSRLEKPLIKLNCATLPENLIESELFGHEKGAFTDAHIARKGKFELAHDGTIFLDEIGEIPLDLQAKLLRVLQEGEFEKLGSEKTIKVDVRIILATNRNLKKMVDNGSFRSDLYYRLNIYPITMPPLRERKDDITILVNHFIIKHNKKIGKEVSEISKKSLEALQKYNWPGNIRELENLIERSIIMSKGRSLIIDNLLLPANEISLNDEIDTLDNMTKKYILRVLESTNWTISGEKGAAEIIGLHPNTLRSKMEKLGITKSTKYQ